MGRSSGKRLLTNHVESFVEREAFVAVGQVVERRANRGEVRFFFGQCQQCLAEQIILGRKFADAICS